MSRSPSPSLLWKAWRHTLLHGGHRRPDAFIQAETGAITSRQELDEQARHFSMGLRQASGSWIAFSMKNQADWMALFLACQAVGAAALPLDSHLPAGSLASTARSLGAHYLWQNGSLSKLSSLPGSRSKMACIKTTSGTTGQIQPVPCLAGHLLADGKNIIESMKIRATDRNLGLIPLGHSYGLGNLVMPLILQGSPLVCAGEFVPSQILPWILKYQIQIFPSVPGVLRMLAQLPGKKSLKPLRTVISAGAILPSETAQAFFEHFGLKIHNFYGSSETGGICYDRTGNAALSGRSVGKALQGVEVDLSASGQIRVSGQAVARAGKNHLLADQGKWNRYGELVLLGRSQAVANIGGRKVAPAEIEGNLRNLKGVSDAWVAVIHLKGRDYLAGAVETALSRKEIHDLLHQKLSSWKIPRFLSTLPILPRTPRGKLDRSALRALFPA